MQESSGIIITDAYEMAFDIQDSPSIRSQSSIESKDHTKIKPVHQFKAFK